jgi:uncharacterized membrane protein (DUF106 family)
MFGACFSATFSGFLSWLSRQINKSFLPVEEELSFRTSPLIAVQLTSIIVKIFI